MGLSLTFMFAIGCNPSGVPKGQNGGLACHSIHTLFTCAGIAECGHRRWGMTAVAHTSSTQKSLLPSASTFSVCPP